MTPGAHVHALLVDLVAAKCECQARGLIIAALLRSCTETAATLRETETKLAALRARCDDQQAQLSYALGLEKS